jgi:hypothetical protein
MDVRAPTPRWPAGRRTLAAALVLAVLALCLSSAAPAAAETGCTPSHHQVQVCGQWVAPDHVPAATHVGPAAEGRPVDTAAPAPPEPVVLATLPFQADPSAPRAPPLS